MSITRVGFIGIGNMGWPMAKNILHAGYPLHVYDADPARTARFVAEHGGESAASPAALGRNADLVVTMLPTGRDVQDVVLGSDNDGLASTLRPGAVVVDMSSSDPVGTRALGSALRERGIDLIDGPVSGLVPRAESGTLTIMIGADDERAFAAAEPVLRCIGERLIRVGALGCGHAMKALNNIVAAAAFTATAEALLVGTRFGLDPRIMTEVLNVSTGRNFHTDISFPDHVLTRRFATGFTLGLLAKDAGIAAGLSDKVGATAPLIELVSRLWTEGCNEIGAAEDNSAIVRHWERLNQTLLAAAKEQAGPPDTGE